MHIHITHTSFTCAFNVRTWRGSNVRRTRATSCSITLVDFEFQIYRCKPNHAHPWS